jgi:hypothetical protein
MKICSTALEALPALRHEGLSPGMSAGLLLLIYCSAHSLTLKKEAMFSSEMSGYLQTTRP